MTRLYLIVRLVLLLPMSAAAQDYPVDSVVHLRKNTNSNQVHYGVSVDGNCKPVAPRPMKAYWLMLEKGPQITEDLRLWEQPGYGVRQPEQLEQSETGGRFLFFIRGVPEKQIELETFAADTGCRARAFTQINNERLVLERIEIEVSGWADVSKVEIFGIDADGNPVSEITHGQ
jgi:hypothetical protein